MKSPLIKTVQMAILPSPPPELPKFDGAPGSDPVSHINAYAIACIEYLPYDDIILNLFLRTLIGEALKWLYQLPEEFSKIKINKCMGERIKLLLTEYIYIYIYSPNWLSRNRVIG